MKSMIEIVYKENKEQANGNEGYFHLPKNIRQVGDTNGRERIYLEDYVGTFLKKYFSAPEGRAAMLFGEFKWADGISYFFIRSAAAIHTMEPAPDHLVFDDAVWTEVHDVMEKYFKNQQILGWALSLPGYGEDLNEQIIRAHLNHFGGNDKTLFRVNGQEKEETFYTYEGGTLRSTGGFYIYYEKNEPMQSYLIDQNQNRSIENGESVPDRAVSDFRKMIEEKSGEEPEHDHRKPILYAMTACAAAALLVTVTQKYGDALPFPGKTKEQTVAVAGNVQGEKTQTAESAAEASAAEEGNTGENTSTPESTGTELETENESGSAAVSEEQNLSGTDPAGSGEQSTSGGEQTGAAENNTGTAQTDPAPGAEPSSAPGTASGSETAETAAQVWQEYIVQKGDTGENTSTPESTGTELETENESGSAAVSEEQNLSGTDPAGSGEQSTSGGEQTGAAENNTGTAQTDPAPGAEPSSAPGTASGSETAETAAQVWQEYIVQKGDSLSKISERYYGTMSRVKDICELNQIAVEDLIYAGQKIYLPK